MNFTLAKEEHIFLSKEKNYTLRNLVVNFLELLLVALTSVVVTSTVI